MNTNRMGVSLIKIAIVISMLSLVCGGCRSGKAKDTVVEVVKTERVTRIVSGAGKLEPFQPVNIHPGAGGPLAHLNAGDGDWVEAGQVLATVDRGHLEEEVRKAESNYLTQSSMGDLFSALFKEIGALYAVVNSSLDIMEYHKTTLDALANGYFEEIAAILPDLPPELRDQAAEIASRIEEEYTQLQAGAPSPARIHGGGYPSSASAADAARTELAYLEYQETLSCLEKADIAAPVSGTVFHVPAEGIVPEDLLSGIEGDSGGFTSVFDILGGGVEEMFDDIAVDIIMPQYELRVGSDVKVEKPVFMIVDLNRMQVKLKVDETDIPLVEVGQEVEVSIGALADGTYTGEVASVAKRASISLSKSPSYQVTVVLDRVESELRIGYSARADIKAVAEKSTIYLPLEAVLMDPYPHVFVEEDGRAKRRKVALGLEYEDSVEVVEGLKPGERVVTKGANKIEEGDRL